MLRGLLKGVLALVLAVTLAIGAGLGYRAWRQNEGEAEMRIATPQGIDDALFVELGGEPQWVTIRGRDRSNPVVLMLHGGPGSAMAGLAPSFIPWERDFTVVQWDQPGEISAPRKAFVPIANAGHFALTEHSDEFLQLLREQVRPLAMR